MKEAFNLPVNPVEVTAKWSNQEHEQLATVDNAELVPVLEAITEVAMKLTAWQKNNPDQNLKQFSQTV